MPENGEMDRSSMAAGRLSAGWSMIDRRTMIAGLCGMVALPRLALAQTQEKIARVGLLSPQTPAAVTSRVQAFEQGLQKLGYLPGKNVVIEYRYAEGKLDLFPALAQELVRLGLDCIVGGGKEPSPGKAPSSSRPSSSSRSI